MTKYKDPYQVLGIKEYLVADLYRGIWKNIYTNQYSTTAQLGAYPNLIPFYDIKTKNELVMIMKGHQDNVSDIFIELHTSLNFVQGTSEFSSILLFNPLTNRFSRIRNDPPLELELSRNYSYSLQAATDITENVEGINSYVLVAWTEGHELYNEMIHEETDMLLCWSVHICAKRDIQGRITNNLCSQDLSEDDDIPADSSSSTSGNSL